MFNKSVCYSSSNTTVKALLLGIASIPSVWAQDHIAPPMVNIPAGNFMMGTYIGETWAKPMHKVDVSAFQMAKYPVTVAEFRKFATDTGFNPEPTCKDKLDEVG
jgi:formylglycine-generating enzyme required for sulfatase activity